jgi:hypothetical protein
MRLDKQNKLALMKMILPPLGVGALFSLMRFESVVTISASLLVFVLMTADHIIITKKSS